VWEWSKFEGLFKIPLDFTFCAKLHVVEQVSPFADPVQSLLSTDARVNHILRVIR
jgi:hypothetical protein